MCLWFDSCFGGHVHQDYGHEPSTAKHDGNGHKASYLTAADEAGRKAHSDARKDRAVVAGAAATRDGHGYTAYAQDRAYTCSAADETLKLPSRNNKVGDDTGYKARFHEPADKEDTTGYH